MFSHCEDFFNSTLPCMYSVLQDVRILPPSLPETNPLSTETKVYPSEVSTQLYNSPPPTLVTLSVVKGVPFFFTVVKFVPLVLVL